MVWAPPRESPSRSGPLPRKPTPCRARVKASSTSLPAQRRCVSARRVPAGGLGSSSRSAMTSGQPRGRGPDNRFGREQRQSGVDVDRLPLCRKTGRLPDGHRAAPMVRRSHDVAAVPGDDCFPNRTNPITSGPSRPPAASAQLAESGAGAAASTIAYLQGTGGLARLRPPAVAREPAARHVLLLDASRGHGGPVAAPLQVR
jgi:hypothetical protein